MFEHFCQFSGIQAENQNQNQQVAGPALLILPCNLNLEPSVCVGKAAPHFQIHTSRTCVSVFCRDSDTCFCREGSH